jgi:hypothetical protein
MDCQPALFWGAVIWIHRLFVALTATFRSARAVKWNDHARSGDAMKALALVALTVCTVMAAHAQSVPAVNSALDTISSQDKVLQAAYENLVPMGIGQDKDAVDSILDSINRFRICVGPAVAVGNVLTKMRDPEDGRAARVQFQYSLVLVLKQADVAVKYTNSYMALLKSPAALAAATKARDAMVMEREQLRSLRP